MIDFLNLKGKRFKVKYVVIPFSSSEAGADDARILNNEIEVEEANGWFCEEVSAGYGMFTLRFIKEK
jgi:hypothetical protein